MQTFEESVANFTTPDAIALAEQRKDFAPTLEKLKKLERELPKLKTTWFKRIEMVNRRRQLALGRGVLHTRLTYLMNELSGGPGKVGMLEGTENTLVHFIARIVQFSSRDLQHRPGWIHLYSAHDRVTDNMRAIEDYLAEAENLVEDGGELHLMLQEKSVQPASVTALASRASPNVVKAESILNTV